MKKIFFTGLTVIIFNCQAFGNTGLIYKEILNSITKIASTKSDARENQCSKLEDYLYDLKEDTLKNKILKKTVLNTQNFINRYCHGGKNNFVLESTEEVDPSSPLGTTPPDPNLARPHIWTDHPYCKESENVRECIYNHAWGKGSFILRSPSFKGKLTLNQLNEKKPHYLICVLSNTKKEGRTHLLYNIQSKCEVSSVFFDYYLEKIETKVELNPLASEGEERPKEKLSWRERRKLKKEKKKRRDTTIRTSLDDDLRSDIKGLFYWIDKKTKYDPVKIPQPLMTQCNEVFKDAYFCTPTLIVLPTIEEDVVDICQMKTKNTDIRVPFLRVAKANSKWDCQSTDMKEPTFKEKLDKKEHLCVPRDSGNIKKSCLLPYIPNDQEVHLRRAFSCLFKTKSKGASFPYDKLAVCPAKRPDTYIQLIDYIQQFRQSSFEEEFNDFL